MLYTEFADLGINQKIIDAVSEMGFVTATPVQEQTIPLVTARRDLLVQAPTGTGKTAAFAIPLINMLDVASKSIQAIVLCPTRELTMQIAEEMKRIASHIEGIKILSVYGGQNIERQLAGIRKKPHIIVGTTGRVMDHLRRKTMNLVEAKCIVLDEADEMLDMGFREDIDFILHKMARDVQTLLFSATVAKEILEISALYQKDPQMVKTTCDGMDLPPIKQYALRVNEENKYELMRSIIATNNYKNILIFCNTKVKVDELNDRLNDDFYLSRALHGDMRQRERDNVMKVFREHSINMLVATDVAARGIDVDGIEAIFNFDIPLDEEYYVHRIGRTARANRSGVAYSFVTGRDRNRLMDCEKVAGATMEELQVEGLTEKSKSTRGRSFGLPTTRFFLNIGMKDGANAESITEYLTANTHIKAEDIFDITLKDIYGFVEIDGSLADEMMALNGQKCFRRKLSIEVSEGRGGKGAPHSSSNSKPRELTASGAAKSQYERPRRSYQQRADGNQGGRTRYDQPRQSSRNSDNSDSFQQRESSQAPVEQMRESRPQEGNFERSSRPYSDRSGSNRGERNFNRAEAPRNDRNFDRAEAPRGERSFDRAEAPRSPRPEGGYNRSESPRNDRNFDRADAPRSDRNFDRADAPRSPRPEGGYNRSDAPRSERNFDRADAPRNDRNFKRSDAPRTNSREDNFNKSEAPRSPRPEVGYNRSDAPRGDRNFARTDAPRTPRSDTDTRPSDAPRRNSDEVKSSSPSKKPFHYDEPSGRRSKSYDSNFKYKGFDAGQSPRRKTGDK